MITSLESSQREYIDSFEAVERARVKRIREEQEDNLRQLRARGEAHIAGLERQTQKMMQVCPTLYFIWTELSLQLLKLHLDYIESVGADKGEVMENQEGVVNETEGKHIKSALNFYE